MASGSAATARAARDAAGYITGVRRTKHEARCENCQHVRPCNRSMGNTRQDRSCDLHQALVKTHGWCEQHERAIAGPEQEKAKATIPPVLAAYAAFKGWAPEAMDGLTLADMDAGSGWNDWPAWRMAWVARLDVGHCSDLIADLRNVLQWESSRMGSVSAGLLKRVIKRLEAGREMRL